MTAYCAPPRRLSPLYFAECSYGKLGIEFQATDRDQNSRAEIVRQIRSGGIDPIKVIEIDEAAGTCRDVTEELIAEANAPREPASLEESCRKLRNMIAEHDRRRDLRKYGVHGW